MARITVELLRRRAEHNEGCLSNLKEIALHQQDIEKIELIGDACRQLEIVYLCNNYIRVIEGLRHLKWLKYLNLAVNNITVIDGLQGCEALERLDLTLNFIAEPTSVQTLLANPFLESLHLTGNPCTKTEDYRSYVIHALPQLKELDGDVVIKAERIMARQAEDVVIEAVEEEAVRVREGERIKQEMLAKGIDPFPPKYNAKGERVYGHTPEERLQMLQEQQEMEQKKKAEVSTPQPGSIAALHQELQRQQQPSKRLTTEEERGKFGRLLLRNEPRVPFHMNHDDAEEFVLAVEPGKFISTTLLSIQVEVDVVRVFIKGKLLQVPVEDELAADATQVQRSTTTGQLKVTVPYTPEVQERRSGMRARLRGLREVAERVSSATGESASSAVPASAAPFPNTAEALTRSTLLEIESRMGGSSPSVSVDQPGTIGTLSGSENTMTSSSIVKSVDVLSPVSSTMMVAADAATSVLPPMTAVPTPTTAAQSDCTILD
ncbi:Leucine-rich repeat/Leucine rich repeat, putative [Leishmania lindenbergi]|uniref:Leucine-rich repeat/Leucine rich repeat n=1 Tax=Leishmania lindenbergi TaxID=651832 RepID=A0AAW3A7N0_9TRYP